MEQSETIFFKQVLIFSAIIFAAIGLSYAVNFYKDDIKAIGLKAAAAANESGKAFGEIMTEDLDPD